MTTTTCISQQRFKNEAAKTEFKHLKLCYSNNLFKREHSDFIVTLLDLNSN